MITVYKVRIHDMLAYQRIRTFDVLIIYVVFDKYYYLTVVLSVTVRLLLKYFESELYSPSCLKQKAKNNTTFSWGVPRFKRAERSAGGNKIVSAAGDNPLLKV